MSSPSGLTLATKPPKNFTCFSRLWSVCLVSRSLICVSFNYSSVQAVNFRSIDKGVAKFMYLIIGWVKYADFFY
jgi:hypothetical protein